MEFSNHFLDNLPPYDYRGRATYSYPGLHYEVCNVCEKAVYLSQYVFWQCPLCVIRDSEFKLTVSFGESKSKKYRSAILKSQKIPSYFFDGGRHSFFVQSYDDYLASRKLIDVIVYTIDEWKSSRFYLYDGLTLNREQLASVHGELRDIFLGRSKL